MYVCNLCQKQLIYFFKSIGKEGKGIYIRKRVNIGLVFGVLLKLVANCDYNWDSPQKRIYLFTTDSSQLDKG